MFQNDGEINYKGNYVKNIIKNQWLMAQKKWSYIAVFNFTAFV